MARLFTDGAELGSPASFWSAIAGTVNASTTDPRSGTYSYYYGNSSVNSTANKTFTATSEIFMRFAFKVTYTLVRDRTALRWTSGGTSRFFMNWEGTLENMRFGASGGAAYYEVTPFTPNVWHIVQVHLKVDASAGRLRVLIDGSEVINYTGNTGTGTMNTFQLYNTPAGALFYYIDDMALNDNTGGSDNSIPDDGRIYAIVPNADGTVNQWTNSGGDSVNNYGYVDEVPYNDADYVSDSTSGHKDEYNMTTFTLPSGWTIGRVWAMARAYDPVAGDLKLGFKTGSTETTETVTLPAVAGYVNTTEYIQNPDTSADWTQADLDGIQGHIEVP